MKLLALDTSSEEIVLALCLADQVHAHGEPGGAGTSGRLLQASEALLRSHGLHWSDLDGLGFGQGPGAFTGLRATCAAVQGLALALDRPAVAIPSLQIVAEAARRRAIVEGLLSPDGPCRIGVAVDARMGEVYDSLMFWDGRQWHPPAVAFVRAPEWVASWWQDDSRPGDGSHVPLLYAGSGLGLFRAEAATLLIGRALAWWPVVTDRAVALGHCARMAWLSGLRLDAAQVQPVYVRDRVALTTAERQAAQRAA